MWWEILPGAIIILGAMCIGAVTAYPINRFLIGNEYRRNLESNFRMANYLRDRRIDPDTNPYIVHGLENIPDGEDEREIQAREQKAKEEEEERARLEAEEEERKRKEAEAQAKSESDKKKRSGRSKSLKTEEGEAESEESSEPCIKTPKERDYEKEYSLSDDDPCRK